MEDNTELMIKKAQDKAQRLRDRELFDVKKQLSTPEGRRLMFRILDMAGVFRLSFVANSDRLTSYNEGRRSIGNTLLIDIMQECPNMLLQMQREHDSEAQANKN